MVIFHEYFRLWEYWRGRVNVNVHIVNVNLVFLPSENMNAGADFFIQTIIVSITIVIGCSAFLLRPTISDKFKIYFDEKLIEGKEKFLSEKVEHLSEHNRPNIILILADDLGQKTRKNIVDHYIFY